MCEIITSKRKLYGVSCKNGSHSSERNVSSWSHAQNNPNDTVKVEQSMPTLANNELSKSTCLRDEQIAKATATATAAATGTVTSEPEKLKEEYEHELSHGTNGNESSQPVILHPKPLAAMASSTTPSDGSLADNIINHEVKQINQSTGIEESSCAVLTSGMKRSDMVQNGGHESKKARTCEQLVLLYLFSLILFNFIFFLPILHALDLHRDVLHVSYYTWIRDYCLLISL